MKNNNKAAKCSQCGSFDTLPIRYGLMTDDAVEENASEQKWVWGGCKITIGGDTDYCKNCKSYFGGQELPKKSKELEEQELKEFIDDRERLLAIIDKYLDEEKDQDIYAQALKEAEGDLEEAEHIYFNLFLNIHRGES